MEIDKAKQQSRRHELMVILDYVSGKVKEENHHTGEVISLDERHDKQYRFLQRVFKKWAGNRKYIFRQHPVRV